MTLVTLAVDEADIRRVIEQTGGYPTCHDEMFRQVSRLLAASAFLAIGAGFEIEPFMDMLKIMANGCHFHEAADKESIVVN